MIYYLSNLVFMLAQNSDEKMWTLLGVTFLGAFIFFLIIDSTIKGKFVPKKGPLRKFLTFLFLVIVVAVILLLMYNKWLENWIFMCYNPLCLEELCYLTM